jgi:hypothetical protein
MAKQPKTVEITIAIPLNAFDEGRAIDPRGSILSGFWLNIDTCEPVVTVHGLPEGTDVEATFKTFHKTLSLIKVTSRKEVTAKRIVKKRAVKKAFV